MADRYPLTVEQMRQTTQDLADLETRAEGIAGLMRAAYGDSDPRTIRAQEAHAALQRLQWEISREHATAGGNS
jgi:hypothetical protein